MVCTTQEIGARYQGRAVVAGSILTPRTEDALLRLPALDPARLSATDSQSPPKLTSLFQARPDSEPGSRAETGADYRTHTRP